MANKDTADESKHNSSTDSFDSFTSISMLPSVKQKSRSVIKSASTSGLSLVIPTSSDFSCKYFSKLYSRRAQFLNFFVSYRARKFSDDTPLNTQPIESPGGSSTASSRDTSPCRELSPLVTSLKPPIIIRRGPCGFGFTVHTIRVYYGDSDFYTMHHLVMVRANIR